MAADVGGMPNGNYAPHQGYGGIDQNSFSFSANGPATAQAGAQQLPPNSSTSSNAPSPDISKDEVGWYFVEQYYTTLSRSPEKLFLFYNKRSQFVSGQETDKVAVCVGQRAINDKIKDLDFHDCKVRVTNVDSQASDSNIVIQVIGELSNKSQPHRKFTQTFVLATQTNGYFVLNDIFRYLVEEEEEQEVESGAAAPAEDGQHVPGTESAYEEPAPMADEPKTLTSSTDPIAIESDVSKVDNQLERLQNEGTSAPSAVNGEIASEELQTESTPTSVPQPEEASLVDEEPSIPAEVEVEPEKPREPEPTPLPSPPKQTARELTATPKTTAPAVPMSWASRAAAANKVATPVTPTQAASTSTNGTRPTPSATKTTTPPSTAPSSVPPAPAQAVPTAPSAQRYDAQGSDSQDEWTAVGPSHNRQQSRQTNTQQPESPQYRGYIKNVHDSVGYDQLKSKLDEFGEIVYFDIARQKNCAFVDFKTLEGYKSALASPFEFGEEKLFVEERRYRQGATPFVPRGQFQGGRGGRGGAGGQGAPRGGFQGTRGSSAQRGGRGSFPAQRGSRGGTQAQ